MINAMLDGAYPHPDAVPREGRVSMNQTEKEFQDFGPVVCQGIA